MITRFLIVLLMTLFAIKSGTAGSSDRLRPVEPTPKPHLPTLVNTCLITNDVARLVKFYTQVLGLSPKASDTYAEFRTGVGVLAIFSAEAQEKYIPRATEPAKDKGVILEFEVDDVDQEYSRLQGIVRDWVKPPTTQPWGTRSIYFHDPDGNLIDFYAWVKAH